MNKSLLGAIASVAALCLMSMVLLVSCFVVPVNSKMGRLREEVSAGVEKNNKVIARLEPAADLAAKEVSALRAEIDKLRSDVTALNTALGEAKTQADANRKAIEETVTWTKEEMKNLQARPPAISALAPPSTSSSPAPVVGATAATPTAVAAKEAPSKSLLKPVEHEGIQFEVVRCEQKDAVVTIQLKATRLAKDSVLTISGRTRIFDENGNEFRVSIARIGNQEQELAAHHDLRNELIQGVPIPVTLTFKQVDKAIESVSALYVEFYVDKGNWALLDQLRAIPVSRL